MQGNIRAQLLLHKYEGLPIVQADKIESSKYGIRSSVYATKKIEEKLYDYRVNMDIIRKTVFTEYYIKDWRNS